MMLILFKFLLFYLSTIILFTITINPNQLLPTRTAAASSAATVFAFEANDTQLRNNSDLASKRETETGREAAEAKAKANSTAQHNKHHFKLENLDKHDNVHKLMSESDLRRTFQVENHDQVPEYQVLRLTKSSRQSLDLISENEPSDFSGATAAAAAEGASSQERGRGAEPSVVMMKLSTFGKQFKLRLKRNVDFQQRIKDMKMFMAESTKDGQLRYTEIKAAAAAAAMASQQQAKQQQQRDQPRQQQQQVSRCCERMREWEKEKEKEF